MVINLKRPNPDFQMLVVAIAFWGLTIFTGEHDISYLVRISVSTIFLLLLIRLVFRKNG